MRIEKNVMAVVALIFCLTGVVQAQPTNEQAFISQTRQITFQGKSGEGYFAPDGRKLIFQSEREPGNPFYQMYILNLENGDTHRVSPGQGKTTCGFFRAGSEEVLFSSTHHDPAAVQKQRAEIEFRHSGKTRRYSWDYDEQMDIFSATQDGLNLKRLTDAPGYDAEGAYSPDGSKIVFSSLRGAFPFEKLSPQQRKLYEADPASFAEIYIMNADGTDQQQLTDKAGYDGGPFFSADGKRIIWRRFEESGVIADVYSMNLDGSDTRRITRFESMSWAPYPHPSGEYIIFTSNKHGFENFELFIVDSEGKKQPARVTFTDGFDGLPVFSPDGKKLCWTSGRTSGKESQLFLANWNHQAALAALKISPAPMVAAAQSRHAVSSKGELSAQITAADSRRHVEVLAADAMQGRQTGTEGTKKAADYIAAQLREIGVEPLTNQNSFLLPFEFTAGVNTDPNKTKLSITLTNQPSTSFKLDQDFRPLPFSENGKVEAEVVFAGYGLKVPGKLGEGYDSYAGLDISNKVVLVLRYVPEEVDSKRRQELNRYAALRYKAMIARELGAKGLLVVTGPNSPGAGELVGLSGDGSISGSQIMAATVSTNVAEALLGGRGKSLKEVQSSLDQENPHGENGFALPGMKVSLEVELVREKKQDHNVVGIIPGRSGEGGYVLLGAHYDHLGHGESSSSRNHSGEGGQVHNGADDNASGVAAVLEIAAALKTATNLQHAVVFGFWSGEEMGLLGSSRFVEAPPVALTNIIAYLNFDMVGRLREDKLTLQGAGSSPVWRQLIEKRNIAAGFNLVVQDDPYLPTDTTAFYPKGIPTLSFFTGSHDDYHRPTDDPETLNYEGLERISQFAHALTLDLSRAESRPEYVKLERSDAGGNRDALRVYLGTVPDYTTEVKGVKLSGVRGGSPAEKGGIKAGDVIVEFAGQKIANIYDYTYALDAAKVGQPLEIVVERDGKRVPIKVTPEGRK